MTPDLMTLSEVVRYSGVKYATMRTLIDTTGIVKPVGTVTGRRGGQVSRGRYNERTFTREQADRLKRYAEALKEFRAARKALI